MKYRLRTLVETSSDGINWSPTNTESRSCALDTFEQAERLYNKSLFKIVQDLEEILSK